MNKYVEYIITIILILILVAMHMLVICGTYVAITDFINVGYDLRVETSWWAVFSMIVLIWMDKIIFIRK